MDDPSRAFAAHVAGLRLADPPERALAAVRTFVLDSLGVAVLGTRGPHVEAWRATLAGPGEARAWGSDVRLPAPAAAAINAYQLHNSEFDCVHEGAVVHTMAVLFPAAMAFAERGGGVSGARLAEAVAAGADVACGLGLASRAGLRFFRPATAGAFGAVAACAKIAGLDEAGIRNAFGIMLGQVSGTMQAHGEGSPLLGMQVGFAARNAVHAVDMARAGVPGPERAFAGPHGYLPLFEGDYDAGPVLDALGRDWRIAETAHKPWPSGRATHGVVEALLALGRDHGLDGVERVEMAVPPLVHQLVGREAGPDMRVNQARLSARYAAARILARGALGIEDFEPERIRDPATLDLARRVDIRVDDNPDPNALTPVAVAITRGGERHGRRVETVLGAPGNPLDREAHLAKFRRNWTAGAVPLDPEAGEALVAAVDRLEELDDVARLADLTRPAADGDGPV